MINASRKTQMISFIAWMIFATCVYYAGQKAAKFSDERRGLKAQSLNNDIN